MIEIKSWDGRVLYTSDGATDLRSAVEEAVSVGASLDGASLDGASLDGARLVGARLDRASLVGARLDGARLIGASLVGARLIGASLDRASLVGARLNGASLDRASLDGASLDGARLIGASLDRASLIGASLDGASLDGARLIGASLDRASLVGARLDGARGINPYLTTPLHILADQPGKTRAYKLVNADGRSPIQSAGKLLYEQGATVEVADASTDVNVQCARGVNVASLDWCIREWRPGYRILIVEFTAQDIAAIPTGSDGKFRLFRCKVVGEKDLTELGLAVSA